MAHFRPCPVCETPSAEAAIFIEENIDLTRLSSFSFASRKLPEYMCHKMVRCPNCDLVYADGPPPVEDLAHAYHNASYDSNEEANDAANSYVIAIKPVLDLLKQRDLALEIGTGTGVFLECLKKEGFTNLIGVEPSSAAIESAPAGRRAWIKEGMFLEGDFEHETFDLICCFMTMEHVSDPRVIADAALRLLKPGGAFVTVTHDYRSFVNRLLGKRSPIIDIEHLQIFSRKSIQQLFERIGFKQISVKSFKNKYSARYWIKISPLPVPLKKILEYIFRLPILKEWRISINVGNAITYGFRER
jgi:SAM-dependent methyltransferase